MSNSLIVEVLLQSELLHTYSIGLISCLQVYRLALPLKTHSSRPIKLTDMSTDYSSELKQGNAFRYLGHEALPLATQRMWENGKRMWIRRTNIRKEERRGEKVTEWHLQSRGRSFHSSSVWASAVPKYLLATRTNIANTNTTSSSFFAHSS